MLLQFTVFYQSTLNQSTIYQCHVFLQFKNYKPNFLWKLFGGLGNLSALLPEIFTLCIIHIWQDAGNRTRVAVRNFMHCHILSNLSGHQGSNLSIQLFINIALYKFTTELRHVVTIYTNSMTGSSCKYLFLVSFYLLSCFYLFLNSWCPTAERDVRK